MNTTITAITITGDRKKAFSFCQQWVANQILKPNQWIIVDDGKIPFTSESVNSLPLYAEYHRREPQQSDPKYTIIENLKVAFSKIKYQKILIIEDDEYYAPNYISIMNSYLEKYHLIGICRSRFYHIQFKAYIRRNYINRASLAQMGFSLNFLKQKVIPLLQESDHPFIDKRIWEKNEGFVFDDYPKCLYVGMKGLPGRVGVGKVHKTKNAYKLFDPDLSVLKKWIPNDYKHYLEIMK